MKQEVQGPGVKVRVPFQIPSQLCQGHSPVCGDEAWRPREAQEPIPAALQPGLLLTPPPRALPGLRTYHLSLTLAPWAVVLPGTPGGGPAPDELHVLVQTESRCESPLLPALPQGQEGRGAGAPCGMCSLPTQLQAPSRRRAKARRGDGENAPRGPA